MAAAFNKLCDLVTRAVCFLLGALIATIVGIAMVSVWWRYVVNDPMGWSEQVSRILFVWMTFLGAAVLYRQRMHIAVDMIVRLLPASIQTFLYWTAELCVLAVVGVLLVFGLKLSLDTWSNTFGALDITPASFYLAAPVSSALIILYFLERLAVPEMRRPQATTLLEQQA